MWMSVITGNLGKDAELRAVKESTVLNFSVAVKAFKKDEPPTWVRCALWGKRADAVASYLTKGTKVTVSGRTSTREYEGKTHVEIDVQEIDFTSAGNREQPAPKQASFQGRKQDESDDIPF